MKNLLDLTHEDLEREMQRLGEKSYRAAQIFDWVYKKRIYDFSFMDNLSKDTRVKLSNTFVIEVPEKIGESSSEKDGTVKYLFRLFDGNKIESVLIKYRFGNSLCISSQVGCRMGCLFCASTGPGFVRDLSPGEFTGQLLAAEAASGEKISHITVMGIGEPLDNYDNLVKFIKTANDSRGLNIGIRNFTVSTCGIPEKIMKLADEGSHINLALSLHNADNEKRSRIMPVSRKYDLEGVMKAVRYYADKSGRRPTYEYILIKDFNDSVEDAKRLALMLRGSLAHVNLIALNECGGSKFKKPSSHSMDEFAKLLNKNGIEVTIRRRLGTDIDAACGQLRRGVL